MTTLSFPAHRCSMGNWTYFVCQLKMSDVSTIINLHQDFFDASSSKLSNWGQRPHEKRKSLLKYIASREDRFFSSIVVGFKKGKPKFKPIKIEAMENNEDLEYFSSEYQGVDVGVLKLTSDPERKMYAIDGQHRLFAIKQMLSNDEISTEYRKPEGFENEIITVIFVPIDDDEDDQYKNQKYRRLFSSLNRYAKPTGTTIDIILDDDDIFAILTRRLIEEHPFFTAIENETINFVAIKKGKAMGKSDSSFTNIQAFYDFIKDIFYNVMRHELDEDANIKEQLKEQIQLRPDEDKIDDYFNKISTIWDAIILTFPEFKEENCGDSRNFNLEDKSNLLFTPIGLKLLGELIKVRTKNIDFNQEEITEQLIYNKIKILNKIPWKLRKTPWLGLVVRKKYDQRRDTYNWIITDDRRVDVMQLVKETCYYLMGEDWNDTEKNEYKKKWDDLLHKDSTSENVDQIFEKLDELRANISQT